MTHSKIQKMKFFVFLLIFLLAQVAACSVSFKERGGNIGDTYADKNIEKRDVGKKPKQHNVDEESSLDITSKSSTEPSNKTVHTTTSPREHSIGHILSLNPGALLRGFYVFLGLIILVVAYIVFRRLNKTRAQMIRKYGVLAHRQDVEMRPLPLDEEDDEDTTVFDASNVLGNSAQHQNI